MTPKEKAEELVNKYWDITIQYEYVKEEDRLVKYYAKAKKAALIAIKFSLENPSNTTEYNTYLNEVIAQIELL